MYIDKKQYQEIIKIFPRTCVDIFISDEQERVLLLLRENQPEQGKWWFPGGRIHFGETRLEAARRKVNEECGIDLINFNEVATFDLFFQVAEIQYHDVTILYKTVISSNSQIKIDTQAREYGWFTLKECGEIDLHPYIIGNMSY